MCRLRVDVWHNPGGRPLFPRRIVDRCFFVSLASAPGIGRRNDNELQSLIDMSNIEIAKPLSRAISIYRKIARRDLDRGTRREVARHIKGLAEQGVDDPAQLTVHGLSHLRRLQRRSDGQ
jgi:hypothetical protein